MEFVYPWLVIASVVLLIGAGTLYVWKRRWAPVLFTLAASGLFFAGARPQISAETPDVRHALVVDVSGSMKARQNEVEDYVNQLVDGLDLPDGHTIERYELSDALRKPGGPRGEGTNFSRIGDVAGDDAINGEILFVTDGHGSLEGLYHAVRADRLIVLKPPVPARPDASIATIQAPPVVPVGGSVLVRATVVCDHDADVPWKIFKDGTEVASGTKALKAGVAAGISHTYVKREPGLTRLRLVLDLPDDREPGNDQASIAFLAGGKRVIAYCTPPGIPPESDGLLRRLRAEERNDVRVRHTIPVTAAELEEVGAVVINNLSLAEAGLAREQTQALADWANRGGNLFMLGARGAFGPGGYRGTPIEEIMPVRFRPRDAERARMILLLDASSSMGDPTGGGETRLDRLKDAARRVLDSMSEKERVAVVGFRQGLVGDVVDFTSPANPELQSVINGLRADHSTHIATSLSQAIDHLGGDETSDARILMITDGEDLEGAGPQRYAGIASRLAALDIRLDVVMTDPSSREWPAWIMDDPANADAHLWQVGNEGFEGLMETLDKALAGADREWIITDKMEVGGVMQPLHMLVRTSPRAGDPSVTPLLEAQTPGTRDPVYPLLAWRQLVGRTLALTTESWGDEQHLAFWQNEFFQQRLGMALDFLLQNANRTLLVLNPQPDGSGELVWVGAYDPPTGALQTNVGPVQWVSEGCWRLDQWPEASELRVTRNGSLLQRIPLPRPVPYELRATGNEEVFFAMAEEGGIRVYTGLRAWQPTSWGKAPQRPVDVTWLPATLALVLIVIGFALRRPARS